MGQAPGSACPRLAASAKEAMASEGRARAPLMDRVTPSETGHAHLWSYAGVYPRVVSVYA